MSDQEYCYPPDFTILRNKLNIRDLPTLEAAERPRVPPTRVTMNP